MLIELQVADNARQQRRFRGCDCCNENFVILAVWRWLSTTTSQRLYNVLLFIHSVTH